MNTSEQVYIWNQEQGNPEPQSIGKSLIGNNSRKMTKQQWKEYWLLCQHQEQEVIDYYNNRHLFENE